MTAVTADHLSTLEPMWWGSKNFFLFSLSMSLVFFSFFHFPCASMSKRGGRQKEKEREKSFIYTNTGWLNNCLFRGVILPLCKRDPLITLLFVFFPPLEPLNLKAGRERERERERKWIKVLPSSPSAINCTRFRIPTSVIQGQVRITVSRFHYSAQL